MSKSSEQQQQKLAEALRALNERQPWQDNSDNRETQR